MIFCYGQISRQKGDGMLNIAPEGIFRGWRLKAKDASLWMTFNNHTEWTSRSGRGPVGKVRLGLPLSIAPFGSQISSPVKWGDEISFYLSSTHSSILAWRIPWTEKPGGLQSTGLQRVRHDRAIEHARRHHSERCDAPVYACFFD